MSDNRLEALRKGHERLETSSSELLDATATAAAHVEVAGEVDPESVERGLEATVEVWGDLLEFLECAADVADAVEEGSVERSAWRETVERLEPPPAGPGGGAEEESFDQVSPLRRLSAPYGVLLELEKDLHADDMKRPFRLRKLKEQWGDFERLGGRRPGEGLGSRLDRFAVFAAEGTDGGRAPWRESDREALAELRERARTVLDWSAEQRRREERRAWLDRADRWLAAAEDQEASAGRMAEVPRRLLADRPEEVTPEVVERLERLASLDELPAELRRRAESLAGD